MARFNKDKPDAAITAQITFYKGEAYRSGFEARVAGTLDLMEFQGVQHEKLNWLDPLAPTPRYKPDFTWRGSNGDLIVVEVKGYLDEDHAQEQLATMRQYVDDPDHDVFALILIHTQGMLIYQQDFEDFLPAAFFKCPTCRKPYIAAKAFKTCPHCGEQHVNLVTEFPNDYYNKRVNVERQKRKTDKIFKEQIEAKKQQQIQNSDRNKVLAGKFSILARSHGLDLKRENLAILTDYAVNQQNVPEFSYEEARSKRDRIGTAFSPMVPIYVSAEPSKLERKHFAEIRKYVDDKYSPIAKAVVITNSGIHVYDKSVSDYEDGAVYTCDKCGKTYISPKSHHDCPFCYSKENHEVSNTN